MEHGAKGMEGDDPRFAFRIHLERPFSPFQSVSPVSGLLGWRLEERSGSTCSPSLEVGGNIHWLCPIFCLKPLTSNIFSVFCLLSPTLSQQMTAKRSDPMTPKANDYGAPCLPREIRLGRLFHRGPMPSGIPFAYY